MNIENENEWREIPGYDGKYLISIRGEIYTRHRGKLLSPFTTEKGYLRVTLCRENKLIKYRVHRLVAQMFIPNPENKPEVNHKDFNKKNNYVDNLEWSTMAENLEHAVEGNKGTPCKPVYMICKKTSNVTAFKSVMDATRHLYPEVKERKLLSDCSKAIRKVLSGRLKTHKGYFFRFVD
jgi:hypothetical protein